MYVALHSTTTSLVSPETEAWEFSAIDVDFDNSSHFSPLVKRSRHNPHLYASFIPSPGPFSETSSTDQKYTGGYCMLQHILLFSPRLSSFYDYYFNSSSSHTQQQNIRGYFPLQKSKSISRNETCARCRCNLN
jgi:hypothetical protein